MSGLIIFVNIDIFKVVFKTVFLLGFVIIPRFNYLKLCWYYCLRIDRIFFLFRDLCALWRSLWSQINQPSTVVARRYTRARYLNKATYLYFNKKLVNIISSLKFPSDSIIVFLKHLAKNEPKLLAMLRFTRALVIHVKPFRGFKRNGSFLAFFWVEYFPTS